MRILKAAGPLLAVLAMGLTGAAASGRSHAVREDRIGGVDDMAGAAHSHQIASGAGGQSIPLGQVLPLSHIRREGVGAPPAPWAPDDPADSVYRAARSALADGDYRRAAMLFHRISTSYPRSTYAHTALYYEAFALYRSGETTDLRQALVALHQLESADSGGRTRGDAATLHTRVCSALARQGDESCAEEIVQHGNSATEPSCPSEDDNDDMRIAALNALIQMDGARAMPILRKVLARRDPCSIVLRRKALFLVAQREPPASTELLLSTAREDPDEGVREQAVFSLSQVDDPHVVDMLDSIVTHAGSDALREKALFALAQQSDHRGDAMLRAFAEREDVPAGLREKAVFWIGQSGGPQSAATLKELFGRASSESLKEKILFSLAQHGGESNWILDVARDGKQSVEIRKKAMFWAAQSGISVDRLVAIYAQIEEPELKEQLIFSLAQHQDPGAVDALMHIARADKDPNARKKAVFWLGQSSDPRAAQLLQELINQ